MEDTIKTTWSLEKCFEELRFDKDHHLGLGDIRLTIAQQEEIVDLVKLHPNLPSNKSIINNCPFKKHSEKEAWFQGVVWLKKQIKK